MPRGDVRMTAEEIARYNAALKRELGTHARLYTLEEWERPLARETLREWILCDAPVRDVYFSARRVVSERAWRRLLRSTAADALPASVTPRWGLCVRRSSLRTLPSAEPLTRRPDDRYDDVLQGSAVLMNEPLLVFSRSADGRFLFALTANYRGWIASRDVAWCTRAEALAAARPERFLLVTGSRVTLPPDPCAPCVSGAVLTMGTRLACASPAEEGSALRGRCAYDNHLVRLPVRGRSGRLGFCTALVPCSADVHPGDLPYTERAVARQGSKTRGEVYGWGGMLGARDCSALVGEIYRCFGFCLPRDAAGLVGLPGAQDVSRLRPAEKRERLRALPVGTLLYFPGHVMLSWGTRDGEPLCLSAAGSFRPPGSRDGPARAVNTVAVTPLTVVRADGRSWLESLTRVISIP